jgi:hypothetical protein
MAVGELGLPFDMMGLWWWDGISNEILTTFPLDSSFINYLPDVSITDESGGVVSIETPTLHIPHNWAGWPAANISVVD